MMGLKDWYMDMTRCGIDRIVHCHLCLSKFQTHPGTSSTAQGGGESFKNRKPIGEVGCCESQIAERSR